MSDDNLVVCPRCRGRLQASGLEPQRLICEKCGQNYMFVLQLVPVEPARPLMLPEGDDAG